jgi:hypothetical protein
MAIVNNRLDIKGFIPLGDREFSVLHSGQADSVVHPASYTIGTEYSTTEGKAAEA